MVDGKPSVKLTDSGMKSEARSKIKKALETILQNRLDQSTDVFGEGVKNAQLIQRVILSKINNPLVADAIKNELTEKRISQYNFARDFNVIKGFLGEVYWSALFSFLGAKTTPVGDIKDKESGQSIAIDLLVGKYGFQVKNFNLKQDGTIQFGTRGKYKMAGTLIKDRAGIDGALAEVMQDLYGSYAYNNWESSPEAMAIREELEVLLTKDASEIFKYYIDRIIRLDAEQEADMLRGTKAIQPDKKMVINTFFLIGDKIIPSSAILDEIIISLKNTEMQPHVNFTIDGLQVKSSSPKYNTEVEWKNPQMANYTGISYTIDLNIVDILDRAYKNAK